MADGRAGLSPEQRAARVARKTRRALRRTINARRDPAFMDRLQHRIREDRHILDRLKGTNMTLSAIRDENNERNVKVQITYGSVTASVVEDVGHARSFHTDLGRLLDEMEAAPVAEP